MVGNILGERFVAMSFGESHGKCIGMVVDGCPAGLPLENSDIQSLLDLRKPGQSMISTQRKEDDIVEIISGVFNGFTTGAPICMVIWNKDSDPRPYDLIKTKPRPGHSDYPALIKYGGLTATLVMAGAIAQKLLKRSIGIETVAYTIQIGGIQSKEIPFEKAKNGRYTNDVRCPDAETAEMMKSVSIGLPIGFGEPIFSSLESDLSKALFSIPAVKAVEFGSGFKGSKLRGSENNDIYINQNGRIVTKTNNSGGILGGLSSGMPIITRIGFKPVASIAK